MSASPLAITKESPGLVGETHIHDPGYGGLWTTAPDLALFGVEVMRAHAGESETVLSQDIEKSSGNLLFDRSATKAISKASPLSPPPVEMEIGVRFYL